MKWPRSSVAESAVLTRQMPLVRIQSGLPLQKGGHYHGAVSHASAKTTKRKFHIVELGNDKFKLKIKKLGIWFYLREGFKVKIFEDFSSIVNHLNKIRK